MPRDRFFVPGVHAAGERVALAPDDARKLVTVLRRRGGEHVAVVDGAGTTFSARLLIDGKNVAAELESAFEGRGHEAAVRIVLAQAIPKGQKMDVIVEKATELGVAAIVPLRSARVEGKPTGEQKHDRWQRIAKSAAQQSGRDRVPVIEAECDLATLAATFGAYDRVYVAWESAAVEPLRVRFEVEVPTAAAILLVVGAEGGFAAAEIAAARAAGATPISLGTRIVRAETAPLVILSALLYARGEL